MSESAMQDGAGPVIPRSTEHEDRIERLDRVFYIRWTSGPNYEDAFLCVEDGEPDMNDIARVTFGQARIFVEAYRVANLLRDQELATLRSQKAALVEAFRNADDQDWKWLYERIANAGHGHFWTAVFNEFRSALREASE